MFHDVYATPLTMKAEGCEGEGRGRRDVAVSAGPGSGSNHPKGMAWVAFEALAHRPRPEDSHPEETRFRRNLHQKI
ncbi:MAG: hypothetical protein ACREQA_22725 [Candidatus Binatia bacterium]